jgi:cell division protein ZapB
VESLALGARVQTFLAEDERPERPKATRLEIVPLPNSPRNVGWSENCSLRFRHFHHPWRSALTGTQAGPNIERDSIPARLHKKLENRVDDLIGTCRQLKKDNQAVKGEHARLIEKTQVARERIESMIGRLKALEHGS